MRQTVSKSSVVKMMIALCALSLMLAAMASAAGKQDFTLHNDTGVTITKLYISAHDVDKWEENILGKDTLADGEQLDITFDPKEAADKWDLRVEDAAGTGIVWNDLDLSQLTDIILHYKDGQATATLKNGG